jgi:hypothetical protein
MRELCYSFVDCMILDLSKMLHNFNSIIWQKLTPYMVVINLEIMQGKLHSNIFMWHADKISKWSCCRLNGKFIWFVLQKLHDMTWIWHKTIGISSFHLLQNLLEIFPSGVVIISHCHVSLSLSYETCAADKGTQKCATETTVEQANSVQILYV